MERLELPAIRSLVQTEQFGSWFAEFTGLQARLGMLQEELNELKLKRRRMLFECDYWRDRADESLLESSRLRAEIENLEADAARAEAEAYRVLMRYENKRAEVTELWEKIGVVELRVDDYRDEATRNRIQKKIQPELNRLRDAYGTGSEAKEQLWDEHEKLWIRSAEASLTGPEVAIQATRLEQRYADLVAKAEGYRKQADELASQVEEANEDLTAVSQALDTLKASANEHFNCLCHREFLYWLAGDDRQLVYLVPLIDNRHDYNIEIRARYLYQCGAEEGVAHLAPVPVVNDDAEDMSRLREIFEGLVEAL
ncbi:MAG: hypothetical protein VX405_06535 [Myxococcota bacterium]|jgi:chromosome segregation ATPase|nr:hypothetical protein [Myxococcales bacterium]MEC7751141.1 hypothetical protein [Myxococcota bacterium]|tara:strand:+ start:398 stop:1333 length:936 start_codon:yes stop_codon:yes gene_type:complete